MNIRKYIPIISIVALMLLAYFSGAGELLTFEEFKKNRIAIINYVELHPILAPTIFMMIYIVATALSLPVGSFLSVLCGFLFGQPLSTIYVVTAATIGATIIFLAAKTAFGEKWKQKAGQLLRSMQEGFQENAASYLLFLRLIPVFPFWLVNLAPAFFGVSLLTYIWTTFLGIIPGAFVYTQAGVGLGSILETDGDFSLETYFTTDIKIALIAIALFALLPVAIQKLRGKKR